MARSAFDLRIRYFRAGFDSRRPLHDELVANRVRPIVPVVILAQAWRGGPQHPISRVKLRLIVV